MVTTPSPPPALAIQKTLAALGLPPLVQVRTMVGLGLPSEDAISAVGDCHFAMECLPTFHAPRDSPSPWKLVGFALRCLREDLTTPAVVAALLARYGIHPWSIFGIHIATMDDLRRWGDALDAPPEWVLIRSDRKARVLNGIWIVRDFNLVRTPAGLKAGSLRVCDCPWLQEIGSGLSVEIDASFQRCGLLEELPRDMKVGESLEVSSCSSFKHLPPALAYDHLTLWDLPNLKELALPETFAGELSIEGCRMIRCLNLPGPLIERLNLAHLSLEALPSRLSVTAQMSLISLAIRELPHDLFVGSDLKLHDLMRLDRIGTNSHIQGDLILGHLPATLSFPEDLQVKGKVKVLPSFNSERLPPHLRDKVEVRRSLERLGLHSGLEWPETGDA